MEPGPDTSKAKLKAAVRPLQESDLPAADRVMRLAFGTFIGLPDPAAFIGDADYVRSRWRSDPSAAFYAEVSGELVGSNFAANWGSFGFFGPLTIHPDLWDRGIGKTLLEPVIDCFNRWGVRHAGLYTFAQSQKHVSLYQKFGFWPRYLTAIMSKAVRPAGREPGWNEFSETAGAEREGVIRECRHLTDAIYNGLDVSLEIRSVAAQKLGETVLLSGGARLDGFAVCHCGPGTEAGSGNCYIKFGAVRPSPTAEQDFRRLLAACEQLAAGKGATRLSAGVNTARSEAYHQMLERGFRTDIQGVAMQKPNEAGYNRPGVYVIDDWR